MAVLSVVTYQVRPGALAEFTPMLSERKRAHERLGAAVRAWTINAAGPNIGRVGYAMRFPNHSALGAFVRKLATDAEVQRLQKEFAGQQLASIVSHVVAAELNGLEAVALPAGGGPRARLGRTWELERGRGPEAVAMLMEVKAQAQRFGGGLSAVVGMFGGPNSGTVVSITEFADVEARGAYLDAAMSDPGLIAAQGRFLSAGSPLRLVAASLSTEIVI